MIKLRGWASGGWARLRVIGRKRVLLGGALVLALALVIGALWARSVVRRGWPQTEGELLLAGLQEPVTVVRDGYGVPHIFAATEADLFFAQGFVHAQDRFWQMELNRRRGRGTLAEVLGADAEVEDAAWRELHLVGAAGRALEALDDETRALLRAYAAGVNAWQERGRWPLEFSLLRWRGHVLDRGRELEPEPWTAQDSLLVSLVLEWQVDAQQLDPALAARVVQRVGAERGAFLLGGSLAPVASGATREALPGRWALGSRRTTSSDGTLLAVDLPMDLSLPAPWYVLAWRVGDKGAAGASAPGFPGLVLGTDSRSAGTASVVNARTLEELQAWQKDTFSQRAARLIPLLVEVKPRGWRQERVTEMLRHWDYEMGDNCKEAPFFVAYQLELARAAFADELGQELFAAWAAQGDLYQAALDQILEDPDAAWWDDVTTPEIELRADVLRRAYEPALEWIGRNYGDLHMLWEWDLVHGNYLRHPLGDAWPWDQLLNSYLALDGWSDTVNASPGGGPVEWGGEHFRARAVYGYRQIVDLHEPDRLWFVLLPGQSGHPFHAHYADLRDEWLAGEYVSLRLAALPAEVEGVEGVLVLKPGD